ncbi:hypothetical protein H671_7g18493 [Cricetulus griseus]|nr:hypothetical protein H671_7g18493 [Cricetulus griseus]
MIVLGKHLGLGTWCPVEWRKKAWQKLDTIGLVRFSVFWCGCLCVALAVLELAVKTSMFVKIVKLVKAARQVDNLEAM